MMRRSIIRWVISAVVVCVCAGVAEAQLLGLPIGRDASSGYFQDFEVSGGLVLGDTVNVYGGRVQYRIYNELLAFGDVGLLDPDRGSIGFGLQGGVLYSLPPVPDLPVDLALRGTLGFSHFDQKNSGVKVGVDLWTLTGGGVASYRIDEQFSLYSFVGLAYLRTSGSRRVGNFNVSVSETDLELAAGVGLYLQVMDDLSFYAELMHVEDPWFGIGVKLRL